MLAPKGKRPDISPWKRCTGRHAEKSITHFSGKHPAICEETCIGERDCTKCVLSSDFRYTKHGDPPKMRRLQRIWSDRDGRNVEVVEECHCDVLIAAGCTPFPMRSEQETIRSIR